MNVSSIPNDPGPAGSGSDAGTPYSLEILARLSGISSETILLYQARGLLRSPAGPVADTGFDDETLRRLRRLECLREAGAMNLAGLSLVACLLEEVEDLRARLRLQR
jgi:hypothetical protein